MSDANAIMPYTPRRHPAAIRADLDTYRDFYRHIIKAVCDIQNCQLPSILIIDGIMQPPPAIDLPAETQHALTTTRETITRLEYELADAYEEWSARRRDDHREHPDTETR